MDSVLIVSAEASSVTYAQRLLEHWKKNEKKIHGFGVGSPEMEALGFERIGKSEEMAIVGAAEIISHFGLLKSVFDKLVSESAKRRPKVAIVMDYPEFNLMLAKKLHKLGIPVVYYISPQVWAWRRGRVKTIKKYCKKVFLLFPFEIPFYQEHQVENQFVGHPILDELNEKYLDPEWVMNERQRCGIAKDEIVLGLMPGSRRLELQQHFEIQLEVARRLSTKIKKLKIVILVAPTFDRERLMPYLENFRCPYVIMKREPFDMISLTDFVMVASGTATLMVGLLQKPMVIMYRMKPLTALIAKLLVHGTKFFGLVNLILGQEVAPERFQSQANPEELTRLMEELILNPKKAEEQRNNLKQLINCLGEKGATRRVVESLEEFFSR